MQQAHYAEGKKKLSYADLCKHLTEWRKNSETQWLSETHSQALQQTVKDLEQAYKNFFEKRVDFPRFKNKGQSDIPAKTGLGALPQQPGSDGCVEKRHRVRPTRQVVRLDPDRTPSRDADSSIDRHCGHRYGSRPLCHAGRRQLFRPAQQFQTPRKSLGEGSACHEPQTEVQQQLEKR